MLYREPARTPQANAGVRARSPRVGGTRGSYPILVFLVCLSAAPAGHAAAGCPNAGAFRMAGDRPAPCLVRAVDAVGGRRLLATATGRATIAAPTRPVRRAPAAPSHLTGRAAASRTVRVTVPAPPTMTSPPPPGGAQNGGADALPGGAGTPAPAPSPS